MRVRFSLAPFPFLEKIMDQADVAKMWLEEFEPSCPMCDTNQFGELPIVFKGTTKLKIFNTLSTEVKIAKFVCSGCGFVISVDLNLYLKGK
jgi:hypothetical protein